MFVEKCLYLRIIFPKNHMVCLETALIHTVYHGNMSNQKHSLKPDTMKNVITFVEKFAELNGY